MKITVYQRGLFRQSVLSNLGDFILWFSVLWTSIFISPSNIYKKKHLYQLSISLYTNENQSPQNNKPQNKS